MKNMSKVSEFFQAPPPGRYLSTITAAEATSSKKSGASMLKLTVRIDDDRFNGEEADDYIITDGTAKGASMGKKKLRGLGTNLISRALDTDEDIPDAAIAQELLGLTLFVDYGNEQKMGKSNPDDPSSPYDRPMTVLDPKLGREVALNKLTVAGYARHAAGAPAQAQQQQAPAPTQFVPQQFQSTPAQQAQFQQQFAPQQAQFGQPPAQQAPAGFPGAQQGFNPQQAQQQFAQPQQQFAYPPQGVAQPVWNGGAATQAPVEDAGEAKKAKRTRA
jgi:hypothetical protein